MDKKTKARAIAFYLPQFYPTPENDEWWEPGFTEWTNVARAKPLFRGHYQPKIPGELSFYDLRLPEVRERQAELARYAGIEGFCYWHYWFAGRRLLSDVFQEVVESGKPDFPFCLCWANHSWYAKTWKPNMPDRLLIEQTYPGVDDYIAHFKAMLPAFKDKRYIKVDGKPLFGVFEPFVVKDIHVFTSTWNRLAKDNGFEGFTFFALVQGEDYLQRLDTENFDLIVFDPLRDAFYQYENTFNGFIGKLKRRLFKIPNKFSYDYYKNIAINKFIQHPQFIPCINPNFDHSPRSSHRNIVIHDSTPEKWGDLCRKTLSHIESISNEKIIFIKAWNEWGEGNYLEPDRKFGRAYINELRNAVCKL